MTVTVLDFIKEKLLIEKWLDLTINNRESLNLMVENWYERVRWWGSRKEGEFIGLILKE